MSSELTSFVLPAAEIRGRLAGASAGEVVLIAQQCLRLGSYAYAIAVCRAFAEEGHADPGLRLTEAAALFGAGEQQAALDLVDAVIREQPQSSAARFYKSQMLIDRGQAPAARELLLEVIARFVDFPGALGSLAALVMPGPHYRDVLARIHRIQRPQTYLEIGVETGATMALAKASRVAVGVDPDSRPLKRELIPANARVFHEESDIFFASHERESLFGDAVVELAYIDGLHLFEQALRDFINVERWCGANSTILIHDCIPLLPLTAERDRRSKFWVGDLWKILPLLAEHRPELRVRVVATPPSGLMVVRGLDPKSRVLSDRFGEIEARYRDRAYPHGPLEWPAEAIMVDNSEAGVREALA